MPRSAPPQKHAASRHRENAKRHNDTKTADRTITDTATRQILRNPHHPLSGSVLSGLVLSADRRRCKHLGLQEYRPRRRTGTWDQAMAMPRAPFASGPATTWPLPDRPGHGAAPDAVVRRDCSSTAAGVFTMARPSRPKRTAGRWGHRPATVRAGWRPPRLRLGRRRRRLGG